MRPIRLLMETANAVLCRLKRSRRVPALADSRDGKVKINLGCGLAVCRGWINVDASPNCLIATWPRALHGLLYRASGASQYYTRDDYCDLLEKHVFVHHDLAHSLPFDDACADYAYSSHFLEHLFRNDALTLLREARRVLKPGGILRICVPDLAYAVEQYRRGRKHEMLDNYFFVEDQSSYLARHKYMYDFELLAQAISEAGFSQIIQCQYREGRMPDLSSLDNRPDESLYVEATRTE